MFGKGVQIVRNHPVYGGTLTIAGDISEYNFQPGQKFVPHAIPDSTHPAKVGDEVVLTEWLAKRLGVLIATVTGVRTMKDSKRSNGVRQVELLGLPCQWFSIGHFEEYQGMEIYDHIWGDVFHTKPRGYKDVMITDKKGAVHIGKPVRPIILPNR